MPALRQTRCKYPYLSCPVGKTICFSNVKDCVGISGILAATKISSSLNVKISRSQDAATLRLQLPASLKANPR